MVYLWNYPLDTESHAVHVTELKGSTTNKLPASEGLITLDPYHN